MDQAESLVRMMKGQYKAPRAEKASTRVIAIASGKGGVGKTNFSVALALSFARMGKEVIVMDADLGLANVNILFGIIPKYSLLNVLQGDKSIDEVITDTNYGIRIIAGVSGISEIADLTDAQRLGFIQGIEKLKFADLILIDTGAGISNNVIQFACASDEVIVLTTPEPTAITDAYGIMKTITAKKVDADIKLVVNRVYDQNEGAKIAERITNIAHKFLGVHVKYLGAIVEDAAVLRSILQQKPFYVTNRKSKASQCIDSISQVLEAEDKAVFVNQGIASFFTRFFRLNTHK